MQSRLIATAQAQPETVALFVSDLHLSPSHPRTTEAFINFLQRRAPQVRQLYLLGDVFEAWIGDDDLANDWNRSVANAIRALSDAGTQVFWMNGNRDLLIGQQFAKEAGCTLLPDPYVLDLADIRIALAHGDAQCTDDEAYMTYRNKVRQPLVQKLFLAMPISWRRRIITGMRSKSSQTKQTKTAAMMDVNQAAIDELFNSTGASVLIHGHTHLPQRHDSDDGNRRRYVLTDWDCETKPERGGWVALYSDGSLRHFDIQGRMVTRYPGT